MAREAGIIPGLGTSLAYHKHKELLMWDAQGFIEDITKLQQNKERKKTMSFLQLGEELANYVEEYPVPEDEYQVRIVGAKVSDSGYLVIRLELTEDTHAKSITVPLALPGTASDEKRRNQDRGRLLQFYDAFGLDPNNSYEIDKPEPLGLLGREGFVFLSAPKDKGDGYGPQNNVAKFCVRV
jgi:hypothetical protein